MAGLESRVDNSGLDKIGGKIEKMQSASDERFAMVTRQVERKAEREDIMGIDRRINEQIHEITVHIERFVEKDELMKKFLHMEKQIRKYIEQKSQHLNNQIANNNINHSQLNESPSLDEGGLLTKKPLGMVACLVCDNKIPVQAVQGDYKAWNKLPQKNLAERTTQYGPGFGKLARKHNHDGFISDSPRDQAHTIAELQRHYGSLSNFQAGDELFEVLKNQSLVGIYEADPRAALAGAERSPDINRINHFLPDSIKGASTTQNGFKGTNVFRPSPTNMGTVGGTSHETQKTRNNIHTASLSQAQSLPQSNTSMNTSQVLQMQRLKQGQTSCFTKNSIPKQQQQTMQNITVEEATPDTIFLQHNNLMGGSVGSGSQPILIPSFPPLKSEISR